MMSKAVVILGAGASFDVANPSVPAQNHLRPPLARELFEHRFSDLRFPYPGAVIIGSELGARASTGDAFDLEAYLTRYAESANPETRRHFREVPAYLRDVLMRCADGYVRTPANYKRLVSRLLEPMTHQILFLILNYDVLLERALSTYDPRYKFASLADYIAYDSVKVIKVHGSTNWFVAIPASQRLNWTAASATYEPKPDDITRLMVIDTTALTSEFVMQFSPEGEDGSVYRPYPWLTAPVRGKTFSCRDDHGEAMNDFVRECHKFLIVGTSGLDDDLLTGLADAIDPKGKYLLHYVDNGGTPARERYERAIPAFIQGANAGPLVRTSTNGFSDFLHSDGLEAFLAAG